MGSLRVPVPTRFHERFSTRVGILTGEAAENAIANLRIERAEVDGERKAVEARPRAGALSRNAHRSNGRGHMRYFILVVAQVAGLATTRRSFTGPAPGLDARSRWQPSRAQSFRPGHAYRDRHPV